jgi:anti-sigma B factor antagonist
MKVTVRQRDGVTIVGLEGELTMMAAMDCLRQLRSVLPATAPPAIAIDLGRVSRIDASGCAALVALRREVQGRGGHLCLFGPTPPVRLLLEVMQIHLVLDIVPSLEGATAALDAQAEAARVAGATGRRSRFGGAREQAARRAAG